MPFRIFQPDGEISHVVKCFWSLDGNIEHHKKYIHRTLANHCPEIIFHYGGKFCELTSQNKTEDTFIAGIHGQTNTIRRFTAQSAPGIFSVLLQPYAIPLLFDVSAVEAKNQLIDLEFVLGKDGKYLSEQMLTAISNKERVQIISKYLKGKLKTYKRLEIIQAIQHICDMQGMVNVKMVAAQTCLSQRQFERNFKDLTGFSPKTFSRIVRFKSLTHSNKKKKSFTEMAYDFGYYDQAHFIQDFKSFSGYTPSRYFNGAAKDIFYAPKGK